MPKIKIECGEKLFAFDNFHQWCNKSQSWFAQHEATSKNTISVDSAGRVCQKGEEFMRARDEGSFPIAVYRILV